VALRRRVVTLALQRTTLFRLNKAAVTSGEQNKKKDKSKVREAKIEEVTPENEESNKQEDDSDNETSPPKYTKNEAIIATIKAMPVKS